MVEYGLDVKPYLIDFSIKKVYNCTLWFFSRTGRIAALRCHNRSEESPDTRLFPFRKERKKAAGTG